MDAALALNPAFEAQVSLRFEIVDGEVVSAEVVDGKGNSGGFDRCVARAALTWSFPASLSGITVSYPLLFVGSPG